MMVWVAHRRPDEGEETQRVFRHFQEALEAHPEVTSWGVDDGHWRGSGENVFVTLYRCPIEDRATDRVGKE